MKGERGKGEERKNPQNRSNPSRFVCTDPRSPEKHCLNIVSLGCEGLALLLLKLSVVELLFKL